MSLPVNIEWLLSSKKIESERIEFKEGFNPVKIMHAMCAFANDFHNLGGGYIIIGTSEKNGVLQRPVNGIPESQLDQIQKEIVEIGHKIVPSYHPIMEPYKVDGKWILILWAPGGQVRPYKAPVTLEKNKREYGYFIKKGSVTVKAKDHDETELMSLASKIPFDDRINQTAAVEDLSLRLIEDFLTEVGSELAEQTDQLPIETIGRRMNIVSGPSESPFPKNIGLMMFNEHPEHFFPVTQIDVVFFPDGPGGDIFEEKEFKGPLHRIIRDALSHIQRNYLKQTVIKYPDRAEADRIWNFPYAAIEEALVNAVYHRSYEIREPVEVRITPEELIVLSFPGPDRSISIEDIKAGNAVSRRYRNRRIGEFLKELDLTEGRSTGIRKIKRATALNGSPDPVFETDEDRNYFIVRLPVHPDSLKTKGENEQVPPPVAMQDAMQVAMQVEQIVIKLEGEKSREELQEKLKIKNRDYFRKAYIVAALEGGFIEYTIPDKPNSRLQKYRLTEKGKELQKQLNQDDKK